MAGNLFGLSDLKKVRLQDVIFPYSILSAHKGPCFGIEDVRKILDAFDKPLVGTIFKPKVGLDPAGTTEVAAAAVRGGLDRSYMGKMARETLENDLSRDALRGEWHGYKSYGAVGGCLENANSLKRTRERPQRVGNSLELLGIVRRMLIFSSLLKSKPKSLYW